MFDKVMVLNSSRAIVCVLSLLTFGVSSAADVAVVANKSIQADSLTAKEAKNIWLGKSKSLGGDDVKPVDLVKGNAARKDFYGEVVKKNEQKLKSYWAKILFSGKGVPPKSFSSDEEVLKWVSSTPGAMGYVDVKATNSSVKVMEVK